MLVITRSEGESITMTLPDGREVKVITSRCKHGSVRIGFKAPKDIIFNRYDEEQKLEEKLLEFKENNSVRCPDSDFIGQWMDNTKLPEFNKSAREVLRAEPTRLNEVWSILKKELE